MHVKPPGFESSRIVIFMENDFPYNVETGIQHFLLWSNQGLDVSEIEEYIKHHPATHGSLETLWFVNPVELRSIPDMWHAHVMVLWERSSHRQQD